MPCNPPRVLGIIPARGGSKGIPHKNLVPLAGQPLLHYTADAARNSRRLTRTILSSDDSRIISVARSHGIEAPFVRPPHLATDTAPPVLVALHALEHVEKAEASQYEYICLLQPTCPLRGSGDIDNAIDLLHVSDCDAVVSVCQVSEPHPAKMLRIVAGLLQPLLPALWHEQLRRQDLPPIYFPNGAVYCVRRDILLKYSTLWGAKTLSYVMPPERSVNIDDYLDVAVAESLVRKSKIRARSDDITSYSTPS